jgi:hypothetical protein
LFTYGWFVAKLSVTSCALINPLNILPNQKIKAVLFGSMGDVIFPLSLIKPEYTELEDKTRCSTFPGKDMDMRRDSLLLYEEN